MGPMQALVEQIRGESLGTLSASFDEQHAFVDHYNYARFRTPSKIVAHNVVGRIAEIGGYETATMTPGETWHGLYVVTVWQTEE